MHRQPSALAKYLALRHDHPQDRHRAYAKRAADDIDKRGLLLAEAHLFASALQRGSSSIVDRCALLRALATGGLARAKASDDTRHAADASDALAAVARAAAAAGAADASPQVAAAASEALAALAATPPARTLAPTRLPSHSIGALLAAAGATSMLLDAIEPPPALPLLLAHLRTLRALTRHAGCAAELARHAATGVLLPMLAAPLGDPRIALGVELLWNAVDADAAAICATVTSDALAAALLGAYERLARSSSLPDGELASEVLAIVTTLARFASAAVGGAGWFDSACTLIEGESHALSSGQAGKALEHETLQLALQLLYSLTDAAAPAGAVARLAPPLTVLLAADGAARWQPNELAVLRRLALSLCANLALGDGATDGSADDALGPLLPAAVFAATSSLHDGRRPDVREATLRLLAVLLAPGRAPRDARRALGSAGVVHRLVTLLTSSDGATLAPPAGAAVGREVVEPQPLSTGEMQDLLAALSQSCAGDDENRAVLGIHAGVDALLRLVSSPHGHSTVFLMSVECLWSACAGSTANMNRLVGAGGIELLLDLLVVAELPARALLLSSLADLLVHGPARDAALAWRAADGSATAAVPLLLSLWREEEARLHGAAGTGELESKTRPLSAKRLTRGADGGGSARAGLQASLPLLPGGDDFAELGRGPLGDGPSNDASDESGGDGNDDDVLLVEPRFVPSTVVGSPREAAARLGGGVGRARAPSRWLTDAAAGSVGRFLSGRDAAAGSLDAAMASGRKDDGNAEAAAAALAKTSRAQLQVSGRLAFKSARGGGSSIAATASSALEDVDMRARVYAVLSRLGLDDTEGDGGVRDSLLLLAVREYPTLRQAEAWRDVADELDARGLRPTTADASMLETTTAAAEAKVGEVMLSQSALLDAAAEADEALEAKAVERVMSLKKRGLGVKIGSTQLDLLRARAEVDSMVSRSFVSYEGPQ